MPLPQQLATAPCALVNSAAVRGAGWVAGSAPFGRPFERWTQQDYSALMARMEQCQAENGESQRNIQLLQTYLGSLRSVAPTFPPSQPQPQPPRQPQPQPRPAAPPPAQPSPPRAEPAAARPAASQAPGPALANALPLQLDCADSALLRDMVFIFQSQAGSPKVLDLLNPRPYEDVIVQAYSATQRLRDEYEKLQPYMAPVPQCMVNAVTNQGEIVLSYRLYDHAGQMLVDVQRMP